VAVKTAILWDVIPRSLVQVSASITGLYHLPWTQR